MNILIIGQCTLHWGRMEFGNIGNYYIIEPFVRELHKVFPDVNITTSMQMSARFCKDENISVVPMGIYYEWSGQDLTQAKKELKIANHFKQTGEILETTPYIDEVLKANLIIDFSGDIWGITQIFLVTIVLWLAY